MDPMYLIGICSLREFMMALGLIFTWFLRSV